MMSRSQRAAIAARDAAAARLGEILGRIEHFDRRCKQNERTDSGEAWTILEAIRTDARAALKQLRSV